MTSSFKFIWDKNKAIELANLIKAHQNLWNPTHPDYKDKEMRHTVMEKIAADMGIERREIERKFKNLLCHYMRELKREATKPSYASKWFAYDALSYLKDRPHTDTKRKRKKKTDSDDSDGFDDGNLDSEPEYIPSMIQKSESTEDPLIDEVTLRPVDHATTSLAIPKDDATIFGEYIANKIRTMDQRTRAIVEYEINSTIFKAEMGCFSDTKIDLTTMAQA